MILWHNLPYLLRGALVTVWLSVIVIAIGTLMGVVLGVAAALAGRALRWLVGAYVFVLRGIPVLVVMFIGYYAFPDLGYHVSAYVAVGSALTLYVAAFITEVVRGAILAVPRGQFAAARSLGMRRWPMLREVVFPQAFRLAVPPLLNTWLMAIKHTSYASFVGVWELSYAAREVVERTFAAFEIFLGVMGIYFCICYPLSLIARRFEARAAVVA